MINDYKYDCRIYVLVTSYDPLKIYLFHNGLVRFTTQKYTASKKFLKKRFIHLTNYSVQKKAPNYVKNTGDEEEEEDETASKWDLYSLKNKWREMGINVEDVFSKVKDLIIKTILSVESTLASNYNRAQKNRGVCFEVYGFDVLFDKDMRPWLLEVNILPSFSSSSPLDKKVKSMLMSDIFHLIGL